MSYTTLRFDAEGPLGVLTLDRQDRLNAINRAMTGELADLVARLETDNSVRVVIVTGAGPRILRRGRHQGTRREPRRPLRAAHGVSDLADVPAARTTGPGDHCGDQWRGGRRRARAGARLRPAHRRRLGPDGAARGDARHTARSRRHAAVAAARRSGPRQADDAVRRIRGRGEGAGLGHRQRRRRGRSPHGRGESMG